MRAVGPPASESGVTADLVLTPAAAAGIPMEVRQADIVAERAEQAPPDLLDRIRTAAWQHLPSPEVYESYTASSDPRTALTAVKYGLLPVSYTHLTLPTNREV